MQFSRPDIKAKNATSGFSLRGLMPIGVKMRPPHEPQLNGLDSRH